jgi:protein ImuA
MLSQARSDLIRDLKERLRRWEGLQASADGEDICSTGLPQLDRLLPRGGLAGGTMLEWLSESEGQGATTLVLLLAARLQEHGGAVVVIDEPREFYPPAAAYLGIDLDRVVVVQPSRARDALWAFEQSLRCPAAGVVLGWSGRQGDRFFRRLQLAAEAGGSIGLLLRPASCRREPSWAEARFLVQAQCSRHAPCAVAGTIPTQRLRIEVLHRRGGFGGEAITLELTHEKGHVHLAALLADPTPPHPAAHA